MAEAQGFIPKRRSAYPFYAGAVTGAFLIIGQGALGFPASWWTPVGWVAVWTALGVTGWAIRRIIRRARKTTTVNDPEETRP